MARVADTCDETERAHICGRRRLSGRARAPERTDGRTSDTHWPQVDLCERGCACVCRNARDDNPRAHICWTYFASARQSPLVGCGGCSGFGFSEGGGVGGGGSDGSGNSDGAEDGADSFASRPLAR